MKRGLLVLAVVVVLVLAIGLRHILLPGPKGVLSDGVLLTKDGPSEAALKVGEKCTVRLTENITTGYSWSYRIEKADVISLVSDEYTAPDTGLTGAPGTHEWTLKAQKPGQSKITFEYSRSWENVKPDETQVYTIKVE